MAENAEQWLAREHPEALADFPTDDTGRNHDECKLTETAGQYQHTGRPGTRSTFVGRRQEAIATHGANELARPCSHCHVEEADPEHRKVVRRGHLYRDLGKRCYNRLHRTGTLA